MTRYLRLWYALVRFSLARELSFQINFLVKIFVEILWLGILLAFYDTLFSQTNEVAGWSRPQYLFFLGCYFAMNGLIETMFLENCNNFANLVRTGELDFYLVQPIDEQFLVTCRSFDWSCAPNVLMGCGIMIVALMQLGWQFSVIKLLLFVAMFASGAVLAYSFLVIFTSASIWLVRNQSLFEIWWLFMSFARYPREIFNTRGFIAPIVGLVFFFLVPIMLVSNVPASLMVRTLDREIVGYTFLVSALCFWGSRKIFRMAMQRYRSASS